MEKQRERARNARQKVDSMQVQDGILAELEIESEFVGYDKLEADTRIAAIINENKRVTTANAGDKVFIFLEHTPFYATRVDQIADPRLVYTEGVIAYVKEDVKSILMN